MKPYKKRNFDINLQVGNENDLYNSLDPGGLTLSSDIYDYIEDCYDEKHLMESPQIVIHTCNTIDRKRLEEALAAWIEVEEKKNKRAITRNMVKMIRLLLIGLLFVIFGILWSNRFDAVGTEIISIIGSFSIWEATAILLEEYPELRLRKRQIQQFQNSQIIIKKIAA